MIKTYKDQIRFQVSRNNVKQPKHKSKKKVFNPMALLLLDPILGTHAWMQEKQNTIKKLQTVN